MGTKTKTYFDRPSLFVVIITIILILLIVTSGILVWIFADEFISRIVLITLICVLSILGVSVLTYLEIRRRNIQEENKTLGSVTSVSSLGKNGYKYNPVRPSAPAESDYTNRSTLRV
ncbi:uncharacterized protein LOC115881935 [Sitophilus oryzae]|uniref:Uncharacterized protein LOC115881935 n=1 Tax=Sitophilus oryzae TaxID=7048 RepID=A0A6J2XWR4_SITOR|nr:uncharacterized protein LOC115881935 [Sitophilus oryzae]